MGLVHGDLKCVNILVDENEKACLADLGLTGLQYEDKSEFIAGTTVFASTRRWTAPEIFDPERFGMSQSRLTKESDVYAFSMVLWEIFTGTNPFVDLPRGLSNHKITSFIVDGHRMQRPVQATSLGLSDEMWAIMERCWTHEPSGRPSITNVRDNVTRLKNSIDSDSLDTPQQWPLQISPAQIRQVDRTCTEP